MPKWKVRCPEGHTCLFRVEFESATYEEARVVAASKHKEYNANCIVPDYAIMAGVYEVEPVIDSNQQGIVSGDYIFPSWKD